MLRHNAFYSENVEHGARGAHHKHESVRRKPSNLHTQVRPYWLHFISWNNFKISGVEWSWNLLFFACLNSYLGFGLMSGRLQTMGGQQGWCFVCILMAEPGVSPSVHVSFGAQMTHLLQEKGILTCWKPRACHPPTRPSGHTVDTNTHFGEIFNQHICPLSEIEVRAHWNSPFSPTSTSKLFFFSGKDPDGSRLLACQQAAKSVFSSKIHKPAVTKSREFALISYYFDRAVQAGLVSKCQHRITPTFLRCGRLCCVQCSHPITAVGLSCVSIRQMVSRIIPDSAEGGTIRVQDYLTAADKGMKA